MVKMLEKNMDDHKTEMEDILYALCQNYCACDHGGHRRALPEGQKMTVYGYARVSTVDQNLDRQKDALKKYGVDRLFCEKISGAKKSRLELDRMLSLPERGDSVVIESLSRLGRSVKNLSELMETFNEKGIRLISLKESIDTSSATGRLLFTIISSLAEFERETLIERTNEGLAAARTRGRLGGRPKTDEAILKKAVALYRTGEYTIAEITSLTGISKSTLYRILKQGF